MKTKEKLTNKDKRKMLIDAINLSYKVGYEAFQLVGHPLGFYNYDALFNLIKDLNQENIEQGGDDFFEYNENNKYFIYDIK